MPEADPAAWVFYDGQFRRYADVRLGLMTYALHYGTGCFEGVRGYWNTSREQLYLLQPEAHYERLRDSARILLLDLPWDTARLLEITAELLRRNGYRRDCYVRPILFKSTEGFGFAYAEAAQSFGIFTTPFDRYLDTERGIRCKVASWRRIPDTAVPVRAKVTGAYVNSVLAKAEAQQAGFDEAIVLDGAGHVAEGSAENLFMIRDGRAVTPPVFGDILEGITRRMLAELLRAELGIEVVERPIDRTELYVCDEVLLCGTGAEVCPVLEIDGRPVGTGKTGAITRSLQDLFAAIARGEDDRYAHWLLPVPPG